MSFEYRNRVRAIPSLWQESMTEQERLDVNVWCPISDEIIKKQFPDTDDIDEIISELTDQEIIDIHKLVIELYRRKMIIRQ
jgi:hypothetical protein